MTIDLGQFNSIEFVGDVDGKGEITRVGTGAKWAQVYGELDKIGRVVVGGRDGDVGVGGFLLGGKSVESLQLLPPMSLYN